MASIKLIPEDEATGKVKVVYEDIKSRQRKGFADKRYIGGLK